MSKTKLIIAVAVLAVLFSLKAFFPEATSGIISKAERVFSSDIDYREVLSELGESIAVYREAENGDKPVRETERTLVHAPVETKRSGYELAELSAESAVNEGEEYVASTPLPQAVEAFLESQKPYSDYALPDKVSYEYSEFPFEAASPVLGYNSSGFGYRLHPIHNEVRFHYGTDFAAWTGEDIYAFAAGTVSFAGYCDSYGNYITIDHEDGWQSLYAHCSVLYVESGDNVTAGEKIALVGDTGLVTGPHLHFELTKDGVYVNPEYYVN